ncbi:hypothetical protein V6N11_007042 [Hibiscus sabdariffa]|uniref:RNase H type-1 domain-containing protein n=1 Tax=Hibiscus sabdariffa TaxID=183260 RepID=A0ABR2RSM2_9ROSI
MWFSVFCWLLWKRRRSMVLDADFVERECVLDRGNRFIEECRAAYSQLLSVPMAVQRRGQWWEGPQRGCVKGFARSIGRSSVIVAELWAISDGLRHAWNGGFRRVELETDNAEATNICNGLSPALQHNVLVSVIHDLLLRSWQVRIHHVGRSGNAVADKLARLGQQYMLQGSYFTTPPVEVVGLVGEEQQRWEDRMMGN